MWCVADRVHLCGQLVQSISTDCLAAVFGLGNEESRLCRVRLESGIKKALQHPLQVAQVLVIRFTSDDDVVDDALSIWNAAEELIRYSLLHNRRRCKSGQLVESLVSVQLPGEEHFGFIVHLHLQWALCRSIFEKHNLL